MVTDMLTSSEAADRLGISDRTLRRLRHDGLIRYIAITHHKILYRPEDCDDYVNSRVRCDTPAPVPKPTFRATVSSRVVPGFMEQRAARKAATAVAKKA